MKELLVLELDNKRSKIRNLKKYVDGKATKI